MTLAEIWSKKRRGDYALVAEMVGTTRDNIKTSILRRNSALFPITIKALERVIKMREKLIAETREELSMIKDVDALVEKKKQNKWSDMNLS